MDIFKYVLYFVLCYVESQATKEYSENSRNSDVGTQGKTNEYSGTKISITRDSYGQILSNETSSFKVENDIPKNISRWQGFGRTEAKYIGVGDNKITIGDKVSYKDDIYPISIISIAYNDQVEETNFENLIFAVNKERQYQIISYAVQDKHLVELWRETFSYEINKVIAWQKNLILVSGNRLELLVKDVEGLLILCSVHLPEKPSQITAAVDANYWIISALLPNLQQINIYRIDGEKGGKEFIHVITIKSKNVQSLVSFRMGLSNYIAIGGKNSGVWRLHYEEPQPMIFSLGPVDQWLAIPLATFRHDVLLLAQNDNTVSVIEPNGYNLFLKIGEISMFCDESEGRCQDLSKQLDLSKACSSMDSALIPTKDGQTLFLNLNHTMENIPDQFEIMSDELEDLKVRLLKHFEVQDQLAESLMKEDEQVIIDLNQNNIITDKWTIDNFLAKDADFFPFSEEDGIYMNSELFAGRSDWSEDDQNTNLTELKELAWQIRSKFQNVNEELLRFIFNDISINDDMEHKITVEGTIMANEVYIEDINGQPVNDWLTNTVRWDLLRPINGEKTVEMLEVNNLKFEEISGIAADDLVFINEDEIVINGDFVIEGNTGVAQDIILLKSGKVNDIILNRDLLMIDQLFEGNVNFENVEILGESSINEIMRSNKPSAILPENLLSGGDEIAKVPAARVDMVDVTKKLNVSYINGVSFQELLNKYSHTQNSVQNLLAPKLNLKYLNNKKFPEDYVRISDSAPIVLQGDKRFSNLKVDELHTGMDVVTDLFGNQSSLFFSLFSKSNNDEDVEEFSGSEENNVTIVFSDLKVDGAIVAGKVNNKTWNFMETLGSPEKSKGRNNERCLGRSTNDIDINDFDSELRHLIADSIQVLGSLTINSKISNISLLNFRNYLSKTKEQRIEDSMIKSPINVAGNVTVLNAVLANESRVAKLPLLNITGRLDIDNLTIHSPVALNNLTVNGLLSGVNLHELVEDTVQRGDKKIELRGKKTFTEKLEVKNLNGHKFNGAPLLNVVTKTSDVMFSGPIKIQGNVDIKSELIVLGLMNNVNLTGLQSGISTDLASFYIPGNFTLAPGAKIKNLNVDGKIQGYNFTEFLEDTVFVDEDFEISTQNLTFLNKVNFEEDLNIGGILNGIDLKLFLADVVFLNRPSHLSNLTLTKSSLISYINATSLRAPLIEGCDVGRWKEEAILLNEVSFVPGIVKFAELSVKGNVNCDTINGRSVASLITLKDPQVIPADVHFQAINITNKIAVNQYINDIQFHTVWMDSLRNNANQTITGAKRFLSDVTIHASVIVESIGDRNLTDIITLHTEQNITSQLNFSGGVIFDYNLWTNGLINGVNVSEWNSRLILHHKQQIVNGSWTINGDILVKGNILGSGVIMDKSLINATESLKLKLANSEEIQQKINDEFQSQCKAVTESALLTQNQIRTLEMFEDIQGLEYKRPILSVINYQSEGNNYLLVSFGNRCAGNIYKWNSTSIRYKRESLQNIGSVEVWATVPTTNGLYLIVSGPHSCETRKPFGAIFHVKGSVLQKQSSYVELFTDIISSTDSSSMFYTIAIDNTVYSWSYSEKVFKRTKIAELAPGSNKFVPFSLGLGLAVWDGDAVDTLEVNGSVSTHSRMLAAGAAVSDNGLTAVTDGIGRIELYRDKKILDLIYIPKPSHLFWIDLKSPGELYLCFISENHKILVYQYKGVAGLVFQASLNYPASGVKLLHLPYASGIVNYLLRYHDKTIHLVQVVVNGQPAIHTNLNCNV